MASSNNISPYFSFINSLSNGLKASGGPGNSSQMDVEQVHRAAINSCPSEIKPYQELATLLLARGACSQALAVFEELDCIKPGLPNVFIERLNVLLRLERFEDASSLHDAGIDDFSLNPITFDVALGFLETVILTKKFGEFGSSDFKGLFFLKYLLHENLVFLSKISDCLVDSLQNELVLLASKYVSERGGTFCYVSVDNVLMVKNRSQTEEDIIASRIWERMEDRIPWLRSCPPHVEKMLKKMPHFSKEYINEIFAGPGHTIIGTRVVLRNYSSNFVNVVDNIRKTEDNPESYDNKFLIFGASDAYGFGCEDGHTFCSYLQKQLNQEKGIPVYKVENHGLRGSPLPMCLNSLFQMHIEPGDIVCLYGFSKVDPDAESLENVDTLHCDLSRPHQYGEIFLDHSHLGWAGNKAIGKIIFQHLFSGKEQHLQRRIKIPTDGFSLNHAEASINLIKYLLYKKSTELSEVDEMKCYLDYITERKLEVDGVIGSVAVNCNPMTLGHQHLLNYAAGQVEHLYVFVIEEDLSFFPFKDRLKLVTEGTAHLPNVTVLRGGRYICTEFTYPEYFSKDDEKNVVADASMEAWYFCEYIAKRLDISVIFLGDEPTCAITQQYNEQMKSILPDYEIEVDIIPRIAIKDETVSASSVRKHLSNKNFESIKEIVPESTYRYLLDVYGSA